MAAWIPCDDCKQYLVRVRPPGPSRVRCEACQKDYDTHHGLVDRLVLKHFYTLECSRCGDVRFDPGVHEDELMRRIAAVREDDPTMAGEELCQRVADALGMRDDWVLCDYCDHVWNSEG
jgi:hypothetical protein